MKARKQAGELVRGTDVSHSGRTGILSVCACVVSGEAGEARSKSRWFKDYEILSASG